MLPTAFDDSTVRKPRQYARILERSLRAGFSMNSDVLTGSLLRTLAGAKPHGSLLELGTGCGLGTCWLLDGMDDDSALISIDVDDAAQTIAGDELAGDTRLTLLLRDGGEFLDSCDRTFDLIYADAWPGKYSHLERALSLLNSGGLYVVDDMLPQPNWPADHPPKVAALFDTLDRLDGFDLTKLAWSTGVVICAKRWSAEPSPALALHARRQRLNVDMAQLKPDEWPADREQTTTEKEVPASTQAAHDAATERAEEALKDRLSDNEPIDRDQRGRTSDKPSSRLASNGEVPTTSPSGRGGRGASS